MSKGKKRVFLWKGCFWVFYGCFLGGGGCFALGYGYWVRIYFNPICVQRIARAVLLELVQEMSSFVLGLGVQVLVLLRVGKLS